MHTMHEWRLPSDPLDSISEEGVRCGDVDHTDSFDSLSPLHAPWDDMDHVVCPGRICMIGAVIATCVCQYVMYVNKIVCEATCCVWRSGSYQGINAFPMNSFVEVLMNENDAR